GVQGVAPRAPEQGPLPLPRILDHDPDPEFLPQVASRGMGNIHQASRGNAPQKLDGKAFELPMVIGLGAMAQYKKGIDLRQKGWPLAGNIGLHGDTLVLGTEAVQLPRVMALADQDPLAPAALLGQGGFKGQYYQGR